MDASVPGGDGRTRDPNLPPLTRVGDMIAPRAPQDLDAVKLEESALADMIVKLAYTVPRFHTDLVVKQLHLSLALVDHLLAKLCFEGQIEQLWQTTQSSSHYK